MALSVGDRLGPYEIRGPLGAGGMGEVYRARDARLQRDVALKVLPREVAADPDCRERFEREAQAAAALADHPHIASVYDIGAHDNTTFIVSQLVEGTSLRSRLQDGPLALGESVRFAAQIADALAAAHERGVVHRDIKPDNVLIDGEGAVKVVDFGIAKVLEPPTAVTGIATRAQTAEGTVVGTASYMSPEQVRGERVDHRSDIFSLGSVLFEMVTGRKAFEAETVAETMTAVLRLEPFDSGPPLPPPVAAIISHCLEKQPSRRFQSARDLAFALLAVGTLSTSGTGIAAPPPSRTQRRATAGLLPAAIAAAALAIGFAAAQFVPRAERTVPTSVRQLTFDSGIEAFPTLSADGTSIVYASNSTGNFDIYLRDVAGRSALNLTADSAAADTHPAISRDGQQIAFRSERDGGGIFVIGRTGGVARRVTKSGFNPTWSQDGARLAFATEGVDARPESRSPLKSQILVADIVTGATTTLSTDDAVDPSWSPSGHRIAYWGLWERNQRDIWTVGLDGSAPVRVTDDDATDWDPMWSPDGKWLYFSSNRSGSMNLWRVAIDERTGQVGGAPEPIGLPSGWAAHASINANGHVAYASFLRASNLDRVAFDPQTETFGATSQPVTTGPNFFSAPQLSHDGKWLAFVGYAGSGQNVFVSTADGLDIRQVTSGPWRETGVNWAPESNRLVFYSSRLGRYQVFTINRDGSELRQISALSGYGVGRAVLSRDGTRVATYEPVTFAPFVIDATKPEPDTTPEALPMPPDGNGFIPSEWSSDGLWILGEGGRGGVLLYSVRDRTYRRLADTGGGGPRWIPGSRRILYSIGDEFFVVEESGARRSLGRAPDAPGSGPGSLNARPSFSWSLSTDGRWLYRSQVVIEADLWLRSPER